MAAPTGLAAFNVGGVTIHRLLQLPIEHEGKTAGYWSLPKESQKIMRAILRDVKLLIVDEVSMLSNLNLAYMHLRLEEVFGGDEWFGSLNVIFVGDLLQLPPVNGASVFEKMVNKAILSKLGCMLSVNIWQETVMYDELTINERQKTDMEYCVVLDEVRRGCPSSKTVALLNDQLIQGDVVEHFQNLQQSGQSPVFLFPTRKSCEQFNVEMLSRLESKVVEVPCSDEIDETSGTQKWSKRAASELERVNKDCNLTAGLEAVLRIAIGARVMLRRNIDTKCGLVNGAIGTVTCIGANCITVQFDHIPEAVKLEKVRSRFIVMKNFYVYRKQFPLILAYAVTIHKCQGLSLDCAVMDLSDNVFCPGMAYVALSRVRTLAGVHLIAFNPTSIMVSTKCLEEINRLRQLYRQDLPAYTLPPATGSGRKRKLSGKCNVLDVPKPKKAKAPPAKSGKPARKRSSSPAKLQPKMAKAPPAKSGKPAARKRSTSPAKLQPKKKLCRPTNKSSNPTQLSTTFNSTSGSQTEWPMLRYHAVDAAWQRSACSLLGLQYCCANRFGSGSPDHTLTLPSAIRDTQPDGNCLFRAFALTITGSQAEHFAVRTAIVKHMRTIAHLLLRHHITSHASVQAYIQSTAMDQNGAWGTEVEILTLSHLLQTNVYTFHTATSRWLLYSPSIVDRQLAIDIGHRSMYIKHVNDHYQVVSSVARPLMPSSTMFTFKCVGSCLQ